MSVHDLETLIGEAVALHQVPGLAVGLVLQGNLMYARGFGQTSVEPENAQTVTPDTLFRIGSVTKPFTATMILRLVENSILDLDRPVVGYDPRLTVDPAITLRMLLSHTAGFPSDLHYYSHDSLAYFAHEVLPTYPMVAPPRCVYHYSNPGINLAGYIAEHVTGTPFTELMQTLLFDLLGMNRTTFSLGLAATYPFCQGHIRDASGQVKVKRPHIDNPSAYPCGFAWSNVHDIARFMALHLGTLSTMQPETLRLMHSVQVDRGNGMGYGLGFRTETYRGMKTVGHNGAVGKFGAVLRMLPHAGLGVVLLFNRAAGFWTAAEDIAGRALDSLLPASQREQVSTASAALPPGVELDGTYLGPTTGFVSIVKGRVWINGRTPLQPPVISRVDGDHIMVNGAFCVRTALRGADRIERELRPLTGVYAADIDTWTVRVVDGKLALTSEEDHETVSCMPLSDERYACDWGVIAFELDASGQVQSLLFADGYRFTREAGSPL